jgi:ABC-type cobalamin/Fe3+-siderophores transport system ATPase subunit
MVRSAASGGGGAVHLLGESGIGKTRLLDELARMVRKAGGIVLSGRAFEAESVRPYGAWIDALRSVTLPPLTSALRDDLLPLLGARGAPPGGGDRNRLDAVTLSRHSRTRRAASSFWTPPV